MRAGDCRDCPFPPDVCPTVLAFHIDLDEARDRI